MSKPLSPAVLRAAAKLIDSHGLAKHQFKSESGAYCITGAVRKVRHGSVNAENSGLDGKAISFNDAYDTTKEDAVLLLLLMADGFRELPL